MYFRLRFAGQVADAESGLFYNYFRSYNPTTRRYAQTDPIGLDGGMESDQLCECQSVEIQDPLGLFGYAEHNWITSQALDGDMSFPGLDTQVGGVDFLPGSQDTGNSFWHAMRDGRAGQSAQDASRLFDHYVDDNIKSCTQKGLARALHAGQDSSATGHRNFQPWFGGVPGSAHLRGEVMPSKRSLDEAKGKSRDILRRYKASCPC
ncbi:RHS repeat-associated core domain-containing protein [Variovorax sp. RT4R15]|uniref:RHS repeat-associated core domain-containing protein n=1 Tax=Variovorax sp. RT4R15 TaxID=3443737 RepID=UPI003F45F742